MKSLNLSSADTYLDAARQHGDDEGSDAEIGDLQTYFVTAFELLSPKQKTLFAKNQTVRDCIITGLCLDAWPAPRQTARRQSEEGPGESFRETVTRSGGSDF